MEQANRLILTALISHLAITKQVNIPILNQQIDAFAQNLEDTSSADDAKKVLAQIQRVVMKVHNA